MFFLWGLGAQPVHSPRGQLVCDGVLFWLHSDTPVFGLFKTPRLRLLFGVCQDSPRPRFQTEGRRDAASHTHKALFMWLPPLLLRRSTWSGGGGGVSSGLWARPRCCLTAQVTQRGPRNPNSHRYTFSELNKPVLSYI